MEILLKDLYEYKILIVDDLPVMRTHLCSILKNLGFRHIDEAKDGSEALALAVDKTRFATGYDLIFSDVHMPVMNGITLLKNLRSIESYAKIPIFMVSTEGEKGVIVVSIISGATDYILKPYDAEVVRTKLISKLIK